MLLVATLPEAFAEIDALLNFQSFKEEIGIWIEKDAEVAAVVEYLGSENFEDLWVVLSQDDKIISFLRWMESTGVDSIGFLNRLSERLGLPAFEERPSPHNIQSKTWEDFVETLFAMYPQEEFHTLVADLNTAGGEFDEFMVQMEEFDLYARAVQLTYYGKVVGEDLRDLGVNVSRICEALNNIFGWNLIVSP